MKQFESTAGEEEAPVKEDGTNVPTDETVKEPDETEPVEGAEPDPDGGGEATEAGENGEEAPGEAGEEEGQPADLKEQFNTWKEELLRELKGGQEVPPETEILQKVTLPQKFSEEGLTALEQKFGITEEASPMFRASLPAITAMINHAIGGLVQHYQGEFAGLKFEKALESVSKDKDFQDAPALRKGIDSFLSDFSPVHRANPALIKKAVIYARGLNAKAQVKAAAQGAERKAKILGKTRPSSPSAGNGSAPSIRLSPTQESAATMYPGGRTAYIKHLQARNARGGARNLEPAAK